MRYASAVNRLTELEARCAELKKLMAAPPDADAVRELYCEIVDRYRDDAEALAVIKPLGDEIRRLERDGTLPSTLVARSERRSKTKI
jgi:hypothetical protein